MGLEVVPDTMGEFLAVTYNRQHGEYGFHHRPVTPHARRTNLEIGQVFRRLQSVIDWAKQSHDEITSIHKVRCWYSYSTSSVQEPFSFDQLTPLVTTWTGIVPLPILELSDTAQESNIPCLPFFLSQELVRRWHYME